MSKILLLFLMVCFAQAARCISEKEMTSPMMIEWSEEPTRREERTTSVGQESDFTTESSSSSLQQQSAASETLDNLSEIMETTTAKKQKFPLNDLDLAEAEVRRAERAAFNAAKKLDEAVLRWKISNKQQQEMRNLLNDNNPDIAGERLLQLHKVALEEAQRCANEAAKSLEEAQKKRIEKKRNNRKEVANVTTKSILPKEKENVPLYTTTATQTIFYEDQGTQTLSEDLAERAVNLKKLEKKIADEDLEQGQPRSMIGQAIAEQSLTAAVSGKKADEDKKIFTTPISNQIVDETIVDIAKEAWEAIHEEKKKIAMIREIASQAAEESKCSFEKEIANPAVEETIADGGKGALNTKDQKVTERQEGSILKQKHFKESTFLFRYISDLFFGGWFYENWESDERAYDYYRSSGKNPTPIEFWRKAQQIEHELQEERDSSYQKIMNNAPSWLEGRYRYHEWLKARHERFALECKKKREKEEKEKTRKEMETREENRKKEEAIAKAQKEAEAAEEDCRRKAEGQQPEAQRAVAVNAALQRAQRADIARREAKAKQEERKNLIQQVKNAENPDKENAKKKTKKKGVE